jgi:hypothetical protein
VTTWQPGQPWRVVHGLDQLNNQLRSAYPNAVLHTTADSWGSLADGAHDVTSDHYPHYYSALGSTAVVTARDFPHAPSWGMDCGVISEHLRRARDPRIRYVIFNGRIFYSRVVNGVAAWTWQEYTGDDQHRTHMHVSSERTAVADSTMTWSLPTSVAAASEKEINDMYLVRYKNPDGTLNVGLYGTNNEGTLVNFGIFGSDAVATYNTMKGSGVPEYTFFTEERALTFAKMFEKTAPTIDVVALAAALAGPLAEALPDNIDSAMTEAAVVAAFQDASVKSVLEAQAFAADQRSEDS